jgi:hypothetical protein
MANTLAISRATTYDDQLQLPVLQLSHSLDNKAYILSFALRTHGEHITLRQAIATTHLVALLLIEWLMETLIAAAIYYINLIGIYV